MDSGNTSGSMHSSSGGEEEYDSRPDSLLQSNFLNPHHHFASLSNPQSSLFSHHQPSPSFFDPSPNLFHAFSHSPSPNLNVNSSSLLNLDVVQPPPRGLRSDPNYADGLANNHLSASTQQQLPTLGGAAGGSHHHHPLRSVQDNGAGTVRSSSSPSEAIGTSSSSTTTTATRNPKKRTRASRRAPTTVLTTDTSNFRAMVQEFTGIPAPPFSGSSPYPRRLDLFGAGSALGSLYPLRPSAQKVHPPPPPPSFLNHTVADATNTAAANNSGVNIASNMSPSSVNYQLSSDHLGLNLPKQQSPMLNMQNQMLSLQFLQPTSQIHHPSLNMPSLGANKSQPTTLPLPSLDDLGMNPGGGGGGSVQHFNANLGGGGGSGSGSGLRSNDSIWPRSSSDGGHHNLRSSFDHGNNYGSSSQQRSTTTATCKLNFSASSSSEFHHDRGLDNVHSRGEGTVESWICPEINEAK